MHRGMYVHVLTCVHALTTSHTHMSAKESILASQHSGASTAEALLSLGKALGLIPDRTKQIRVMNLNIFTYDFNVYFLSVNVLPACMCVDYMCAWCLRRPGEALSSLEVGTGGREPPFGYWRWNLGSPL